jgi:hypothetical protein
MDISLFSIALGAAAVGLAMFLKLCATKGVPAAIAWVKAKWNAGKADIANLQGDVAGVQSKLTSIETVALADIKTRLAALEGAVAAAKPALIPAAAASA